MIPGASILLNILVSPPRVLSGSMVLAKNRKHPHHSGAGEWALKECSNFFDFCCDFRKLPGFYCNNHQIGIKVRVTAFSGFWIFDLKITLCGFYRESMFQHRFQMASPSDKEDLVACRGQTSSKISADSPGAMDNAFHRWNFWLWFKKVGFENNVDWTMIGIGFKGHENGSNPMGIVNHRNLFFVLFVWSQRSRHRNHSGSGAGFR